VLAREFTLSYHRDSTVSQSNLIAGINPGCCTDSRSVGQIPTRHIGSGPNGGVVGACGVAKERLEPDGGVEVADGVIKERIESAGAVVLAVVLLKSAPVPRLVLSCAAAIPARESEKISVAIRTDKNKAVLVEW
jgi:hypothetical protein